MLNRGQAKRIYDTEFSLYDYAVRTLTRKMRTVVELKRLLRAHAPSEVKGEDLVELVIARLKKQNYLNDSNYASIYARTRKETKRFGKNRIALDLKAKGVFGEIIQKEVSGAFQGTSELSQITAFLQKKHITSVGTKKEKARLYRMLMRAGFTSGSIFKALQQLEESK